MKSANKEILLSFFQNNYQYVIPFFQRAYVWDEENWEVLWEHLEEELEAFKNGEESEHFIGTIITKPMDRSDLSAQPMELIDGQQRLTTIAIVLKALADTVTGEYANLEVNIKSFLIFKDSRGEPYKRILHGKNDSPNFDEVLKEKDEIEPAENQLNKAYFYFKKKLESYADADRDQFKNVLLNKVPVISMLLNKEDDEQEIFDTINSLGTKLTTAELLKNYLFRDDKIKELYEKYWFNVFESDDSTIEFWNANKTSGRTKRTNHELLLYCFLIIETGKEVRIDRLFKEFKKYLKDVDISSKVDFLKQLSSCAAVYFRFPSGNEINQIEFKEHEKRLFHVIEYLEITTVYPLLIFIYQRVSDDLERLRFLRLLESYLVRRLLCKLTNKNYNRLFIQIVNDLKKEDEVTFEKFNDKIHSFEDDTNRMPSDTEFREAFEWSYVYNKYAREVLFCISLKMLDNGYSDVNSLTVDSYSVEHMMPKQWEANWMNKEMTEKEKSNRNNKLKTVGNLTLITGRLNSKMRNASWESKKVTLKQHSKLPITTPYLDGEWNEVEIENRADELAKVALEIWN